MSDRQRHDWTKIADRGTYALYRCECCDWARRAYNRSDLPGKWCPANVDTDKRDAATAP